MHAYANPAHETRIRDILIEEIPGLHISLSCEVSPEIREYERTSTVVANAYVQPLMASYLTRLEKELEGRGFRCPLYLMTSGGGLTTLRTAARLPDPAGGERTGGRRHPCESPGARERGREGALLRHGRHHCQDLPHR